MTILDLVQGARNRFVLAGISASLATLDAEVLARRVLGWDRARFLADRNERASSGFLLNYEHFVARRERREPVSYIIGTREFWGLDFEVGPDVLIPRQETEFIVEETLERVAKDSRPLIIDVGTGSGCLAIVLAREIPGARVVATVPPVSAPGLTPEVRDYEPSVALFGGEDGLKGLQSVLEAAAAKLAPDGWLIMEFGCGQDDHVTALVEAVAGLNLVKIRNDLQDIPRTAIIRRAE
jgi:release factor glutamine methyltransferase